MQTKKAVALRYKNQVDAAPRVVAQGAGVIAKAIVRRARENHVPVHEDEALSNALMSVELGSVIPEELYSVVAEVLAFVYKNKRL